MKSTYLYKIVKPHDRLIKFALSVVVHWTVDVFPLASRRVSTGLWTCFHWPVDRADALLFSFIISDIP